MANTPQSEKRARQNTKRAMHNKSQRSAMRTAIKQTLQSVESEKSSTEKTAVLLKKTISLIDRFASKKLIHKNKAGRLKSRLIKKTKKA
jgi:small subunit ribosomal protein S20